MFKKINRHVITAYREGIETLDNERAKLEAVEQTRALNDQEQALYAHMEKSRAKLERDALIHIAKNSETPRRLIKELKNQETE